MRGRIAYVLSTQSECLGFLGSNASSATSFDLGDPGLVTHLFYALDD